MVVEIGVSSIVLRLLTANKGVLSEGFVIFAPINCNFMVLKSATIIQYTIKGRFMSR